MILDRLRRLVGGSDGDDRTVYRCVNCGAEFDRNFRECPDCAGPFVAPVDGDSRNA